MKLCNNCKYLNNEKKTHSFVCLNSKSNSFKMSFSHGKSRKACSLYKSKSSFSPLVFPIYPPPSSSVALTPLGPYLPDNAKFIEDYYDKHKGVEIWVLGEGPPLDDYPDNFFDNKITMAIKFAFRVFPRCTYIITSHNPTPDWLVDNQPEFLNKCILVVFPYYSEMMSWPRKEYGNAPIWMRTVHTSIPHRSVAEATEDYKQMIKAVMKREPILYQALWSPCHCAITASVIFGAKKITLIGCDMKASKNRWRAAKIIAAGHYGGAELHEYSEAWQRGETKWARMVRRGTSLLAELFKPYGIDIQEYHYKTGYKEIKKWTE